VPLDLLSALQAHRVVAIVRSGDSKVALDTVLTLVDSGIELVEVSLTTVDALAVVARARDVLGESAALGVGTVLSAADARRAADSGASFVVTPGVTDALAECRDLGLPALAGALTPTEVVAALDAGATAVKLFPASLGGVAHLCALRAPFPDVPFVPVGGVDARVARDYLAAGAIAVGVGGPLVGDGPEGLADRIAAFRVLVTV